jgi:hypothetical protein
LIDFTYEALEFRSWAIASLTDMMGHRPSQKGSNMGRNLFHENPRRKEKVFRPTVKIKSEQDLPTCSDYKQLIVGGLCPTQGTFFSWPYTAQ